VVAAPRREELAVGSSLGKLTLFFGVAGGRGLLAVDGNASAWSSKVFLLEWLVSLKDELWVLDTEGSLKVGHQTITNFGYITSPNDFKPLSHVV
jgi:hypothetical protein